MTRPARSIPRAAAWCALAVLCCAWTPPASAAAPPAQTMRFDIAPQGLTEALIKYSRQTGIQVSTPTDLVDGKSSASVVGSFSPAEALLKLLEGTGLRYDFIDAKTVAIRVMKRDKQTSTGPHAAMQMLLAGAAGATTAAAPGATEQAEVTVQGQRERTEPFSTANLDLTRTEDDVLPFAVFDARDIAISGASSLQEFLQNRLPQNFNPDIPDEMDGSATGSTDRMSRVDMRGWGETETVFLLNGRRMGAEYQRTNNDTLNATGNLQGIPLSSIERIEIIASAGSAIYGASATGGVINIITRQDFKGGQVSVNYESAADVHAPRRRAELSYGLPLAWGTSLRMAASYIESEPLHASHRSKYTIERWRRLALEREPSRIIVPPGTVARAGTTLLFGTTPNITSSGSANLFSGIPGVEGTFTSVPEGYAGGRNLTVYQPGVYNLDPRAHGAAGNSLLARDSTLGTSNTNATVSLGLDKRFSERWSWSLDYRHARSESVGQVSGALDFSSTVNNARLPRVPAGAPNNPFGIPVRVTLVDPHINLPELKARPENVTWDVTSTLRGQVGRWRGFFDLSYTHNRNHWVASEFWEPAGGWAAAFESGAYDPFVDMRVTSPASDPAFYRDYVARRDFRSSATRSYQAAIKASGPVFDLPAGAAQLTAGLEGTRSDRYYSYAFTQYQDGLTGAPRVPVSASSDVILAPDYNPLRRFMFDSYAAYAEVTAPLFRELPLLSRLDLFASGRMNRTVRDGFKSQTAAQQQNGVPPVPVEYVNTSHIYAYGFMYAPFEGITFRASQSIGFKPPTVAQVTPNDPPTSNCSGCGNPMNDPVRGEPVLITPAMYIGGGNPDLRPETTQSVNLGLILAPPRLKGLRLALDYLENVRDDAITSIAPQEMINFEPDFPDRVQRAAPDGHASGVGPITFVDLRQINLRRVSSRSLDITLEQVVPEVAGGTLTFLVAASRNLSFKVQGGNTTPAVEQVRNASGVFSSRQVAWNANGQVRWEGPRWSLSWSTRYFDYLLVAEDDLLLQGADRAPWKLNHDLMLGYQAPALANPRGRVHSLWSGVNLGFGIKNVFDRAPRFWAASIDKGVAPYDSMMGRSLWMQLRRPF